MKDIPCLTCPYDKKGCQLKYYSSYKSVCACVKCLVRIMCSQICFDRWTCAKHILETDITYDTNLKEYTILRKGDY